MLARTHHRVSRPVTLALALVAVLVASSAHATGLQCCGSSSGGGGTSAFADLTSGTNSTATMTCGTGCSLLTSGSGAITASDLVCASAPCVSNAETTATNANTASAIVARDGSGNFIAGTITAALTGNASTATALAANPADCSADTYATTIAASGALTCASITNASTTGTAVNTGSTLVLRDGSGNFAAGTITGALTGNASTATALAANPSDCSANQFATTIAASGNLTCAQPNFTDLAGTATAAQSPLATLLAGRTGSGNNTIISTNDNGQVTLANSGASGSSKVGTLYGSGKTAEGLTLQPNSADATTGTITLKGFTDLWPTLTGAIVGSKTLMSYTGSPSLLTANAPVLKGIAVAPTATSDDFTSVEAFNSGGSIDRTGTTGSLVYQWTGFGVSTVMTSGTSGGPLFQDALFDHTHVTQYGNAACTASVTPRACCTGSGTGTCAAAVQNTWQPISFLSKAGMAASGDGDLTVGRTTSFNSEWQVTAERNTNCTASVTPYACCTGSGTGTCGTASVIALTKLEGFRMKNPTVLGPAGVTIPSLVALSVDDLTQGTRNTSLESLGTAVDLRHAGPALFGRAGAPTSGYSIESDGAVLIGAGIADPAGGTTTSMVNLTGTIDQPNNVGHLSGATFAPTIAQSDTSNTVGFDASPAITQSGSSKVPALYAFRVGGTTTATTANFPLNNGFASARTYTSATAGATPASNVTSFSGANTVSYSATSGSVTVGTIDGLAHNSAVTTTGAGGTLTVTNDNALDVTDSYTQTNGTLVVTNRRGLRFAAPTDTSNVIVNNMGVDCEAQTKGSTENACIRSAIVANTGDYFLHDTGGAQSSFAGKFTTYNNVATAGLGMPALYAQPAISATKTGNFTVLTYTPPATAGVYRVGAAITTTSSTNTGTLQCTLDYTDSQGTAHTADVIPIEGAAGTYGTTATAAASKEFHCAPTEFTVNNAAAAVTLKVVIVGAVSYTVTGTIEQLG